MTDKKNGKNAQPADVYFPPNRLAKAIGVGSGPSLRAMEEEAERRLSKSKTKYDLVLKDTVARMKNSLRNVPDQKTIHDTIFADAHDIKGQAAVFGFELVGEIADCVCTAIRDVPEKLVAQPELLNLHINALEWAFLNEHNDDRRLEKDALVKSLHDALDQE